MKKAILFIGSVWMILVLAACGSAPQEVIERVTGGQDTVEQDPVEGAPVGGDTERQNPRETPLAMQLMMGTFKLEETGYPVTPEQAAELLPLWKALRSLGESETTAAQELQAVVNQIEDTLTSEQMSAIEGMELSLQDMRTIAEEMGIEFGGAGRFGNMTPEMQATMEAARESGQFPGGGSGIPGQGGGPGGGGGFGGPGGLSPEARETAIAERGGVRGANLGLNPALLDAIIEFLEAKIQ